jgi:Flp pilus assembly pilin Flp
MQTNRAMQLMDKFLKDGRKADAVEYALVAAAVLLSVVAVEAALIGKISNEFNIITNRF